MHEKSVDKAAEGIAAVTTGPIEGSSKHYLESDSLRIPLRRVTLTTGEHLDLYDTSGPYTDTTVEIDLDGGLPERVTRGSGVRVRLSWNVPEPA